MGCLFDDADIGKQYANVPCTCVHKIYVKILYIITKFTTLSIINGIKNLTKIIQGWEKDLWAWATLSEVMKTTISSKSQVDQNRLRSDSLNLYFYSVDFDLAFTGPDTVYDEY